MYICYYDTGILHDSSWIMAYGDGKATITFSIILISEKYTKKSIKGIPSLHVQIQILLKTVSGMNSKYKI